MQAWKRQPQKDIEVIKSCVGYVVLRWITGAKGTHKMCVRKHFSNRVDAEIFACEVK